MQGAVKADPVRPCEAQAGAASQGKGGGPSRVFHLNGFSRGGMSASS